MSAKDPLWDVFLALRLASRHEADKLAYRAIAGTTPENDYGCDE